MTAGLSLLVSLAGLGCAAGEMMPAQRFGAPVGAIAPPGTVQPARPVASRSFEQAASRAVTALHAAETEDSTTALLLSTNARCSADMALVEGHVCVDRWEGALVEHVPGRAERPWSPYLPVDGRELLVRAVSRPGVVPQAYISGKQAQTACMASGKRLCNADEWERACRGPAHTQFPYGQERRAGVCNDDIRQVHPVAEVGALLGIERKALWRDGMNQPLINQLPDTLLATGERAECTNEYGVFDMVGNVHEWIDDPEGTFRGGYYMDTSHNGDGCAYATTAHDFTYHDYSTGFRCCADPERVE